MTTSVAQVVGLGVEREQHRIERNPPIEAIDQRLEEREAPHGFVHRRDGGIRHSAAV